MCVCVCVCVFGVQVFNKVLRLILHLCVSTAFSRCCSLEYPIAAFTHSSLEATQSFSL